MAQFPHSVDCYLLEARNGMPPHPGDEPIATVTVYDQDEVEKAKKEFKERYPGSWVMERPLDTR